MTRVTPVLAFMAMTMACDNPVTPHEEHEEPAGLAVFAGGSEILRAIDGEIEGALPEVEVGAQSEVLTVVFLDEHGDGLDLAGESDVYLRASPANTAVATWEGTGYTGRIIGQAAGGTTIQFDLMHGEPPSGGHPDFTSLALDVVVVAP